MDINKLKLVLRLLTDEIKEDVKREEILDKIEQIFEEE